MSCLPRRCSRPSRRYCRTTLKLQPHSYGYARLRARLEPLNDECFDLASAEIHRRSAGTDGDDAERFRFAGIRTASRQSEIRDRPEARRQRKKGRRAEAMTI